MELDINESLVRRFVLAREMNKDMSKQATVEDESKKKKLFWCCFD